MSELFQNNLKNQTEITDTKSLEKIWLGNKNVIKTFSDEDLQNVHDVEEIQKLLDGTDLLDRLIGK